MAAADVRAVPVIRGGRHAAALNMAVASKQRRQKDKLTAI